MPCRSPDAASSVFPPDESVIPRALGDAGYRAALFGKWHLGYEPEFHPLRARRGA